MSDLFTMSIATDAYQAQLVAELARAHETLGEINAMWAADRRRIAAEHPVVEAAVAAVESHFADARLRELALAVKYFQASRNTFPGAFEATDNAPTRQ